MSQNELIKVKFVNTGDEYIGSVDVTLEPHITPDYFLKFYENLKDEAKNVTPECTSVRLLCTEEGKYNTTVETFKFPFVSERYCVLTVYRIPNYRGKQGEHIYIASSKGNKDK